MATTETQGHGTHSIAATLRDRVGSRHARRARQSGALPGVLYGHGQTPVPIAMDFRDASRYILAGEKVFNLALDGGAEETALLKDIQYDHLGKDIIHVDLERVDLDERVNTSLTLRLKGEAAGLKTAGAILQTTLLELGVECRVRDILEYLDVDIDHLEVDGVLHAGEIKMPDGYTLLTDSDAVIASIHVTVAKEEETTAEEGEAVAEGAEPEVITEKKDGDSESSE